LEKSDSRSKNILLFGLDEAQRTQLREALSGQYEGIRCESFLPGRDRPLPHETGRADLIFCAAEPSCYLRLLKAFEQEQPNVPIIVVSSRPDVDAWLDAIEAGASDYCSPPFEPSHIQWMVQAALKPRNLAA
jgi:DNA-binding NtrC family response regulator